MSEVARLRHRQATREPRADAVRATARHHLYYAFLSYSHADEDIAKWLHDQLESFRVPGAIAGQLTENGVVPRRLTPIFRDRGELAAADDLGTEIRDALAASRYLVVLCSPDAARSHWTNAEIDAFKRSRPDGCVLAAIVAGEPFASDLPGREKEECLPPALRIHYDSRGRPTGRKAEPLAADLRQEGEGRRRGFLQLVAGMTGVGLDDLIQRETIRRHRRMAIVAAASIGGMAVTSALAVTAIDARDAARDQRREAESLVGFMLGDLRSKLEPIGKLDALDGVGSRVLSYYQKQGTSDLPDEALMQRSKALSLMGEVANLRGDLDGAMRLYREALEGTAEAVQRKPNDPQRLFDHAQNQFWVGEIGLQRGDLPAAEAAFRNYRALATRMIALDPHNMRWRMEGQYADANLGVVLFAQRRFAEASSQFQQAQNTIEAVATADPGNTGYRKAVPESLAWLADAQLAEGRLADALGNRRRQVALLEQLATAGGDVEYRQKLIPARRALGSLYLMLGQDRRGFEELSLAVEHAHSLIPREPDNSKWNDFASRAELDLAEHLVDSGKAREARNLANAACGRADKFLARTPDAQQWRANRRDCLLTLSRIALASGDRASALSHARLAVNSANSVQSTDRVADRFHLAKAHRLFGDVQLQSGATAAARNAWLAALAALQPGVAEKPAEISERHGILQRLGRRVEAERLAARLQSIGYRKA